MFAGPPSILVKPSSFINPRSTPKRCAAGSSSSTTLKKFPGRHRTGGTRGHGVPDSENNGEIVSRGVRLALAGKNYIEFHNGRFVDILRRVSGRWGFRRCRALTVSRGEKEEGSEKPPRGCEARVLDPILAGEEVPGGKETTRQRTRRGRQSRRTAGRVYAYILFNAGLFVGARLTTSSDQGE